MSGWIKVHRKLMDDPIFQNDKLFKVWMYCLFKASHKQHELLVGLQTVIVEPGEFVFGRKKAADELGLTDSTVWRHVKKLETLGNLNIKSNNKYSLISVVNWGKYQSDTGDNEQQSEQQMNNKRTTNEQQMNTYKNVKNVKNVKNKDIVYSDFEKLWKLYPNKKGKPKALASYKKAIKDGVTNQAIQDGIIAYSNYVRVNQTDKQFIKHGSTFFNNRAWEDDYTISESNNNHSTQTTKLTLGFTEDAPSDPSEVVYSDEALKLASEQIDKGEFIPKAEDVPKINDWRKRNGVKELDLNAKN